MKVTELLEAAIAEMQKEIVGLTAAGVRSGCVVSSQNGNTKQSYWVSDGKRVYVKKAQVSEVVAECDRYRQVQDLRRRIDLIQQAL
jgi:SH3-like domain-containing protein